MADTLTLPLKGIYFDQIKSGEKKFEYRLITDYWRKRLVGRSYDKLVVTRGYPKLTDFGKRLSFPYRGYVEQTITHEHFGPNPVNVFAIHVGDSTTPRTEKADG